MKRFLVLGIVAVFALALRPAVPEANGADENPAAEGEGAVQRFFTAWNTGDNVELRKAMHFPFVTMFGANVSVAETPEDFSTDFEGMKARNNWVRSSLDSVKVIRATPASVYLEVEYGRHNADGERYAGGTVFYIANKKDGEWRLQFRSPMQPGS